MTTHYSYDTYLDSRYTTSAAGLESIVVEAKDTVYSVKTITRRVLTSLVLPFIMSNNLEASSGKIYVANQIDVPYTNCRCLIFHYPGALEGFEGLGGFDYTYDPMFNPSGIASKIVSIVEGKELNTDSRPENSTTTISLPLSLVSQSGDPITISSDNRCYVELTSIDGTGPFANEDVFIAINGETFDVRELIANHSGTIPLPRLEGTYGYSVPYATATVSFVPKAEPKHIPNVETLYLSQIGETSATLEGKLTDDGGESCSYEFTYWKQGDTSNPTGWECCKNTGAIFSKSILNLTPNTTYYFKAFAKNSLGTGESTTSGFTTPNGPVIPPVDPPVNPTADTLYILNKITGFSSNENQKWALKFINGATEEKDKDDVVYARPTNVSKNSKIISTIWQGRIRYQVAVDSRPQDTNDISLQAGVESNNSSPVYFSQPTANELVFSFPPETKDNFKGKPITFWETDPLDPNKTSPIYDVRKIIELDKGSLKLDNLIEYHNSGVPYLYATLSASRKPGDVFYDRKLDFKDYAIVASEFGKTGASVGDVAGPKGLGMPDGKVDYLDVQAILCAITGNTPIIQATKALDDSE